MPDLSRRTALVAAAAGMLTLAGCAPTLREIGATRARRALPVPHGSTVGFYGDSLTSGYTASSPAARWSTILCAGRGWGEVNPSLPGIGFVQARRDRDLPGVIIEAQPQLVIVTLGANDLALVGSMPAEIQAAIASDFARLRDGLGQTPILVAMPFLHLVAPPEPVTTLQGWLRTAASEIGAGVIESGSWMKGLRRLTTDGVHYGDEGELRIAHLMDAALTPAAIRAGADG